jgi:stearoyl-CoA desaturase (delta-9 desaturase)
MSKNVSWQHSPKWNGKISLGNSAFLLGLPLVTAILIPYQIWNQGFTTFDFVLFSIMTTISSLSVTAGYHRLFSHQTFEASWITRFFLLVFGAGAFQNSAFKWCSDHRYHHRFVDKEGDPYNINRGFFYAHMGWIFYQDPEERTFDNAKDLAEDPLIMWQHKYYLFLGVFTAFVIPTLIGWMFGRPLAGFVWGGVFRVLFVHHGTFLINSLAHTYGSRPYSTRNTGRDNWWLAFFTNGEGFHNFHHTFANDYRNGLRWFHWDPTKWLIQVLQFCGQSWNLQRTPEAHILKAKMETSLEQFRSEWRQEIPQPLENMRLQLEAKIQELQGKMKEFQIWREQKAQENVRWRAVRSRYWRKRLSAEKRALESAVNEYRALLVLTQKQGYFPALS